MNRTQLVKECLRVVNADSYLEIGVSKGQNFLEIVCDRKVAVDPHFRFDWESARQGDPTASFFEITSDEFFFKNASQEGLFDVIFLDGLHTAEQTLRDFASSIDVLKPGGIIVIDDVVPDSYLSSLRLQAQTNLTKAHLGLKDRGWMGDVYRLVPFIQTFFQHYSYALPAESGKCLVVWKATRSPGQLVERTLEDVGRLPFEATILDAEFYNRLPWSTILEQITSARTDVAR